MSRRLTAAWRLATETRSYDLGIETIHPMCFGYNSCMVALANNSATLPKHPLRVRAQNHTYRLGAWLCSKSISQAKLRGATYGECNRLESCSKDPIGYVDGLLSYAMVGNSPLVFLDPLGKLKIYDVDDSPKCVVGNVLPGGIDTDRGAYWGIMVELSEQEKKLMLKSGGGYLIFTVDWNYNEWSCPGDELLAIDKTYWIATAIVVYNGEVKMHHTNDDESELQYLQILNYTKAAKDCGNKDRDVRKVTVELVPKDVASKLLHLDKLPNVPHIPSPEGPGPVNDEVGVDATGRPWRKGADRSKLSRATATSTIEFNYCVDPAICNATSNGTSGSKPRSPFSTVLPVDEDDYPWQHTK
jgi:hypothetical protein